jgi:OmpA-OmpF porin, OOP family
MRSQGNRPSAVLAVIFMTGLAISTAAYADDKLHGVITARGHDGALMVRTDDMSSVIVVMDHTTKVRRTDGLREMKMSSASLMPGLRVRVEGKFFGADRFAAQRVKFSRSDLKAALASKGGIDPIDQRSLDNRNPITIVGDQEIRSAMTVYFRNGSAAIREPQRAALERIAQQAKAIRGVVIQVEGHASAIGSDARNERLSMQRAHAVAAVLSQNGITPTQMLVRATKGISSQVADNTTYRGQLENRRVVVTVLQNKAIAESSTANSGSTAVGRLTR